VGQCNPHRNDPQGVIAGYRLTSIEPPCKTQVQ
jgi:hypothetical protein